MAKKYLDFIRLERPKLITEVYLVVNPSKGDVLGVVKFYPQWRRYVFVSERGVIYDSGCLAEIKDFIDKLMLERKEKQP